MCLSASLWMIIHKNLQNLRNNGYVLHLTKDKRLEVITFKDKRYFSFVQGHKDKEYKHYINFNDEWATLLDKIPKINNTLFKECEECYGIKTPIYLEVDKRMKRSKLTRKELARFYHIMRQCKTSLDLLVPIAAVRVTCRLTIATAIDLTANIAN